MLWRRDILLLGILKNNFYLFISLDIFSNIFCSGFQVLCPRTQPSFVNAVSVVISSRKMIPVFWSSRPAE